MSNAGDIMYKSLAKDKRMTKQTLKNFERNRKKLKNFLTVENENVIMIQLTRERQRATKRTLITE